MRLTNVFALSALTFVVGCGVPLPFNYDSDQFPVDISDVMGDGAVTLPENDQIPEGAPADAEEARALLAQYLGDAEAERESSAALYAALDSLETNMFAGVDRSSVESTPADAQNGTWSSDDSSSQSANSNLKSQSLREVEGLAREARSFVEGVRSQLERLQGNVVEKVKLEASVAIRVADFVVRRAILDTGRAPKPISTSRLRRRTA